MKSLRIIVVFFAFFLLWGAGMAQGATLYLVPDAQNFTAGQEFTVDIKTNTENISINAVQALVEFPSHVLTLLEAEKEGSIFNFWAEEPFISNEDGTLRFIGGTTKGVSGSALQILKMRFKASGLGTAELTLSDSAVVASDGKGTNVLSKMEGATYVVSAEMIQPETSEPESTPEIEESASELEPEVEPEPAPVEQPERVVREPILTGNLPAKPELTVPLYPDPSRWYNHLGEMIVFWEVPDDVIKIATQLDRNPYGDPQEVEEVLFTGKSFGTLEEGVWYIHIQFRNNIGWGERAHHKISLDTTPPLPFEIEIDNKVSDNPSPEIRYETNDSLSGIAEYSIFIDGKGSISTSSSSMVLSPQGPGKYAVRVRAVDFAENGVEDNLEFEILPLPTPTIGFITRSVHQGELIFVSGETIPKGFVDIRVSNKVGQEVFSGEASSDELGNWEIIIEEPLVMGIYTIIATARDDRGAMSYSTEKEALKIKAKTIISIGLVDLGWFEILLVVILLVISATSIVVWYYVSAQKKREAYKIIVGRDIDKLSDLLVNDLKELKNWIQDSQNVFSSGAKANAEHFLKKMETTITKMKKYLGQEIKKLK